LRSDHGSEIDRMHIRFLGSEEDGRETTTRVEKCYRYGRVDAAG